MKEPVKSFYIKVYVENVIYRICLSYEIESMD